MGIISKLIKFKIAKEIGSKALSMFRNRGAVRRDNSNYPKNYQENKLND
jgi:hypothetical protein